jgi:hypothetical protein
MPVSSRTVLIPIVGARGDSGVLASVRISDVAPRHHPAGLNPQIADLINWRLYEAGANALGAISCLNLPYRRLALWSRIRPRSLPGYASVINGTEVAGLNAAQNRSAELGLALGFISFAGQSRDRMVVATGQLATYPAGAQHDAVEVLPVGHIDAKIATLRRAIESADPDVFPSRLLWFVPKTTFEGKSLGAEHAAALAELNKVCRDKGLKLRVCPVGSLAEAVRELGVSSIAPTTADKVVSSAMLAGFAGLALVAGVWLWLTMHLPLSFKDVTLASGEAVPSPARASSNTQDRDFILQDTCSDANRLPLYRIDDWMLLNVSAADAGPISDWLGGYHFTLVAVSNRSGVKVLPLSSFRRGRPGEPPLSGERQRVLKVALPVKGPAEMTKLFILARRGRPFDEARLRLRLKKILADEPSAQKINAAEAFLDGVAPGSVSYPFRSVEEEPECGGRQAER